MLEVSRIRNHKDEVIAGLSKRNIQAEVLINKVLEVDEKRRNAQRQFDDQQAEMNKISKSIGQLFAEGKTDEANQMRTKTSELKESIQQLKDEQAVFEEELKQLLYQIPNVPSALVKQGKTPEDNEVVHQWGSEPKLHEGAVPHWELTEKYDLIDFELGVKLTGAGFPVYKGKGAMLQRALINFFLNEAIAAGYQEIIPPHLVNEASGYGTGQLPDKEGQMYHATVDNLYLIPTAEVPITNILRDVILREDQLPVKMAGYTPCFRREAGSYGKDVRGLNRLHQFDKVEIVQAAHPDKSYQILDEMVKHVQGLLEKLGTSIPYFTPMWRRYGLYFGIDL
jgi:seryl-tRNA synthetase